MLHRRRLDGSHAGVVHAGDAGADAAGGEQVLHRAQPGVGEQAHGNDADGDGNEQREQRQATGEVQRYRRMEGQHGDEVHRPDAAAQADAADPLPAMSVLRRADHPCGDVQGDEAGDAGDEDGQQDQPGVVGTLQQHSIG